MAVHLMVNPPQVGVESADCVELYQREYNAVKQGLKERAKLLSDTFNAMKNVSCTEI